jgi:hypothetical protein
MLNKLIRILVVGLVLYVVWVLLSMVLTMFPAVVMTVIGVVLVLVFCAYILRVFNITL